MIDKELLQEFKNQKEIVRYLLEQHPESRFNSNAIMAVYMREIFGIDLTEKDVEYMTKATSLRTVVRVRVQLSNKGIYPFVDDPTREETFRKGFTKEVNNGEAKSKQYDSNGQDPSKE